MADLSQLDDTTVFIVGLGGYVHEQCSPWSSQEIEAAYAKSIRHAYKAGAGATSLPTTATKLCAEDPDPFCNVCLASIIASDIVMVIPVTVAELKDPKLQARARAYFWECNCPMTVLLASGCQNPFHH